MERERVLLSLFGKKLVAYKKLENGEIKSSGVLNPIFNRFKFFAMMAVQSNFYKHYDIGTWKGPDGTEYKVANTYAPPVKSGAMWRALKQALKGRVFFRPYPIAMTFAVTYKCQCNCVHCSAPPIYGWATGHVESGDSSSHVGIGPYQRKPVLVVDEVVSLGDVPACIDIRARRSHMAVDYYTPVDVYPGLRCKLDAWPYTDSYNYHFTG